MRYVIATLACAAILCGASGCSDKSSAPPPSGAAGAGGGGSAGSGGGGATEDGGGLVGKDGGKAAYPPGPYGPTVGHIVEDQTFFGYRSSNSQTLEPLTFHDFYNPDGTRKTDPDADPSTDDGAPIHTIFFSTSAAWCNPCRQEAKILDDVANKFQPAGVHFMQDLYEGPDQKSGNPATENDLKQWEADFSLPFWVFLDPKKKMAPYFDVSALPFTMLVDAKTMKILYSEQGFGGQAAVEKFICKYAAEPMPSICP